MRILWLKTELLHPVDKGGKIRTYNMLKELKREHYVTYVTLDDGSASSDDRARSSEYCHELICVPHPLREKFTARFYIELLLNLMSSRPYAIKKYESATMVDKITELERRNGFDLLVCDFLAPATNIPRELTTPTVLFQHNVEAVIWQRHYEVQTNPIKKAYLYNQWRKMLRFEKETCRRFDCVIAVSEKDRDQMKREYGAEAVFAVPTGVDTEFFRPSGTVNPAPHSIVFTGSMDWLPNEDAIIYFMRDIMPLIKTKLPEAKLTVVGRNPPPSLIDLSKGDSSLVMTGRVEDVRPYIESAAAYIVPLRIGGGTRLKIFEAMAMEKPVVSTTVGAEGLPLTDGVELLLADEPESFADAVVKLLTDSSYASELGRRAAVAIRLSHGWQEVTRSFVSQCLNNSRGENEPRVTQKPVSSRSVRESETIG